MLLLDNAREAREALSRQETLEPLRAEAGLLTRAELEAALHPALAATVATARSALAAAALAAAALAGAAPDGAGPDGAGPNGAGPAEAGPDGAVPWVLAGRAAATPLVARLVGGDPLVLRHPRYAVVAGAALLAGAQPADLGGMPLDEQRTYAVGGGHVSSVWRATAAPIEELRRVYRVSLADHDERPDGRWSRRRDEAGLRHFHDVSLFDAADPAAAGLAATRPIPDHLPTIVREDTAVLPAGR